MFIYIILIFLSSFHLDAGEKNEASLRVIEEKLSSITPYDRNEIKLLFRDLFFNQGFAYSLFGDKPLSFSETSLFKPTSDQLVNLLSIDGYCQTMLTPCCEPSSILEKRWAIWNKHKDLFCFNNYILFIKLIDRKLSIVIINRSQFRKIFDKNIDLFRKNVDRKITYEKLLSEFEFGDKSILEILHHNEGLLGILLGFGTYNAMLFQKREEFIDESNRHLRNSDIIKQKIEKFNALLQPLHKHDMYIIATANRIGFVANPDHSETIQLRTKYDELNKKINEIYSKDDWFEQTLIQLIYH